MLGPLFKRQLVRPKNLRLMQEFCLLGSPKKITAVGTASRTQEKLMLDSYCN